MGKSTNHLKKEDESHRTPMWVKVFGIIAIIIVILIGIIHLTGNMPRNHTMTGIVSGVK